MPSLGKRPSGYIDLTNDDGDENPQRKHARISGPNHGISQPRPSQSLRAAEVPAVSTRDQWGVDNEEDEIIDLSQDIDEGVGWTVLGSLDGKIVGIRYYVGYATPGEQVIIKREPGNPYDSNAVRVNNVQGTQIGHLPRPLAAKLAPYLVNALMSELVGLQTNLSCRTHGSLSLKLFLQVRRAHLIAQYYSRSLVPWSPLRVPNWRQN